MHSPARVLVVVADVVVIVIRTASIDIPMALFPHCNARGKWFIYFVVGESGGPYKYVALHSRKGFTGLISRSSSGIPAEHNPFQWQSLILFLFSQMSKSVGQNRKMLWT